MLNDRLGPCVFAGLRRPTLALPSGLFETLNAVQRDAVIVHELAHIRRGDHWIRWFEAASVVLFWWHPVVWIARRELRMTEELSCDGWVLATLPAARRAYADALVDTLDFLAATRPALPPLASGFGPVHELRRRLHMILKARPAFRPGRAGAAVALGLGLFLPLSVANSQDREKGPPPRPKAERPEPPPPPPPGRDREGDRSEINRLRAELEETQARMMETRQRMARIRNRLAELGVDVPPGPGGPPRGEGRRPDAGPPGRGGRGEGPPRGEGRRGEGPPRPDAPPPPPPPGEGRRPEGGPPRGGPGGAPARGEGRGGPDRRAQELERQIDELRRELEALRRAPKPPTS
jgi:hypothetical protein